MVSMVQLFVYYVSFSLLTQDNKSGRSALIHAVENNSIDMVTFLIEVCECISFFSVEISVEIQ